jgi:hypothetical protein
LILALTLAIDQAIIASAEMVTFTRKYFITGFSDWVKWVVLGFPLFKDECEAA